MTGIELRKKILELEPELKKVADRMGITPQDLQSKLNAADIKVGFLQKVASALNTSVYQILEGANTLKNESVPGELVNAKLVYEGMRRFSPPSNAMSYFDELAAAQMARLSYMSIIDKGPLDPDATRDAFVRESIMNALTYMKMKKDLVPAGIS